MICKNCGCNVAEGFAYCTNCGAQMPTATRPAFDPYEDTGVLETGAPTPAAPTYEAPKPTYKEPKPTYTAAPQQAAADPGKVLGIVSLILGILSLVSGGFPAASVVGIILGSMGKKKSAEAGFANGLAKTGTILSIIGIILFVLVMIGVVIYYIFIFGLAGAMSSTPYYY